MPFDFHDAFGRPAGDRNPLHAASRYGSVIGWLWPRKIYDPLAVRAGLWRPLFFGVTHQNFCVALSDSLVVNVKSMVAVRVEEDGFAVGRPAAGPVKAVVECESLQGLRFSSSAGQLRDVDVALALIVQERKA